MTAITCTTVQVDQGIRGFRATETATTNTIMRMAWEKTGFIIVKRNGTHDSSVSNLALASAAVEGDDQSCRIE
jgi:hypothetical protein